MKSHILFSVLLLVALALVLASPSLVLAETSAMQGGNYVLTPQSMDRWNILSGGGYRLSPTSPQADTSGCCCKGMLPCILK